MFLAAGAEIRSEPKRTSKAKPSSNNKKKEVRRRRGGRGGRAAFFSGCAVCASGCATSSGACRGQLVVEMPEEMGERANYSGAWQQAGADGKWQKPGGLLAFSRPHTTSSWRCGCCNYRRLCVKTVLLLVVDCCTLYANANGDIKEERPVEGHRLQHRRGRTAGRQGHLTRAQ